MKVSFKFPVETLSGRTEPSGLVFAKWRTGIDVARRHVIPRNPQSTDQILTRQAFTESSQAYSLLTYEQRAQWTAYAQKRPLLYRGNSIVLPEINLFNKVNILRKLSGGDIDEAAPVDMCNFSVSALSGIVYHTGDKELSITIAHNCSDISSELFMVEVVPTLPSAMVRPAANDYRLLCGASSASFKIPDVSPSTHVFISPRFATWANGEHAWFRVTPISSDGDIGTPYVQYCAITVQA